MKYLPKSKLAEWRKANAPGICPITHNQSDSWVVDHDHETGIIRGVIDDQANVFLGRIENAYKRFSAAKKGVTLERMLEGILGYLEAAKRNPAPVLHHVGLTQLCKRFKNNLTAQEQVAELRALGAKKDQIEACKNAKDRTSLYRSLLKE